MSSPPGVMRAIVAEHSGICRRALPAHGYLNPASSTAARAERRGLQQDESFLMLFVDILDF
ncbi:hypothetical protein [Polaromonas sp.]|uniref:hypothetical protein n=1 Tax=Polaromonas sp. TaxID=1869339 RepID=UPI003266CF74